MRPALTHRERVQLALDHQTPDRAPISLIRSNINPPARAALEAYLRRERGTGSEEYLAELVDLRAIVPRYIGPPLPAGTDYWGVHRVPVSVAGDAYDEIDHYPLAGLTEISELDAYPWPRADWFDYSVIPGQIAACRARGDYATWLYGAHNPFESSWYLFGFERIFQAMVEQPELVQALLNRVTDVIASQLRGALAAADGQLDLVYTADDIAGQQGLLLSLDMWAEFIKPCHQRLNAILHGCGTKVIYHSDGAVTDAVPGLIDMGIDVLEALQFDAAGMDPRVLKTRHGHRLCFAGGVSVQKTLPSGSVDDVRRETRLLLDTLGRDGGYLCGPSHAIQAGTPPENIVAMFDEAATV